MRRGDLNNNSALMSTVENGKTCSSTILQAENETETVSRLPSEYLGIPLVDHDSPGNETFVVIARRFGKQIVYRFNKKKSLYLFSPRSSLRKFVIFLSTNQYFELFILLLIIANCILLAIKDQPEQVEYVFAALYTMEMILKIIAKGFCLHKFAYLRDPWNWLDFVVVILGYLTMAPSVANFSGIRTFRVLRALRTISVIEGLRTMVNAFLRSMRMLTDVLALSLFFISIFALVGMQLFVGVLRNKCVLNPEINVTDFSEFVANESNWLYINGDPVVCGNSSTARSCPPSYTCFPDVGDNPNHGYTSFDTFPWALLCTIQLVTADYWENVYEYIIASNGFWSVFYFLVVIFFGSFYILNLILAVVALSYQQELANLKNLEAGHNHLKATSSSYSLHTSFKPQKLFPTKPSKPTSNWSFVLRRYTKTSPYLNNPAPSPGPYYPSSPDDKTVQSPLTLDKVTPYAFDSESIASFYNYEADRINSGTNFGTGFDIEESEGTLFNQADVNLGKPGKHNDVAKNDPNNEENKAQNTASFESIECTTRVLDQDETAKQREHDADCCNRVESNNVYESSDKTEGLRVKQKKTKQKTVGENHTWKMDKNPYEGNTAQSNSMLRHENSMTCSLEGSETIQTTGTLKEIHSSSDPVRNITATETNGSKYKAENDSGNLELAQQRQTKQKRIVSETSDAIILDNQSDIPTGKVIHGFTDSKNRQSTSTSGLTPVAWNDSPRKSIETGLASARNTGLVIIQTSSVCVMIPQVTNRRHSPVNEIRRRCAALIMNPIFDWFVISVIFLNTIVMATEYHGMNQKLESILDNINLACTFVFIVEMFVKVTALSLRGYVQSRWNILDGFIVLISIVEMMIVWCVPDVTHGLGFSVLRTFRLIRILKLAQSWVTMRALLSTIGASIGQLGNLTLLLAIVTYTFAVIGMQLFSESYTADHFEDRKVPRWNFDDFLHSFMIIFRVLCGEWIEPLVVTMHVTTSTAVVFYFAVLIIGNFLILNLFLALLLNSFSTESLRNGESKRSGKVKERFRRVVKKYINVTRVFRAFRVAAKTCRAKRARKQANEDVLRPGSTRQCEDDAIVTETNSKDVISNERSTISDAIDQSSSKTQSRATCMTKKTPAHRDDVVPDCFPKFVCRCFNEDEEHRSMMYMAFILSRTKVLSIVEHRYFDAFILFIIFISSVSLALEDVHLDSKPDLKTFLKILNYVVTVIFALEFLLKLFGLGFQQYFRNAWNCLDFFIVVVSIVSLIGSVGDGNLTAFRSLRTLRALRPLRAIPRWQGMKVVVNSLLSAIPEIGNVSLVCLIFWLIFSVMGVQFFGGRFYKCLDNDGEVLSHTTVANKTNCLAMNYTWKNSDINFDNSLAGFLALFQVATFEGWIEVMADAADVTEVDKQPQRDKNHAAHLYFVVFVLFGSFFVLNLFVGVIIDNFNRLKKEYESGAVGLFLTESQRAWYDTLKKAASKKPRKVAKRPKEKWRAYLFDVVSSSKFEFAIMMLIILNMIIMMMRHHGQSETVTNVLVYSNSIFTAIFFLEALFRLGVQRVDYFKEPWNVFDFIVVLLSIAGLIMEYLNQAFIITPSLFRVVRVFRVGRLLRFYKNARGVRRLLFALLISLPALVNIGALLFLLLFIYAIIGMSSFAYVQHSGAINDMVNFETFRNSMLLLFRLSTSAGWNDVLAPLMVRPPDCDPTYDDLPNGNCGNPYFAVFYFVSFVLITSLIIINMYIAVIMENLHEAFKAEAAGITHDDLDMFYQKWEQYDPHATQYIPHNLLSDFVDSLEEPMRLQKPNKFACINLHIPIQEGDRIHCVDVLQALVRQLLGDIEQENPEAYVFMQKKLEEAFLAAFPNRAKQRRDTTTFLRNREICAALVIQKAWRAKVLKNRTLSQ